MLSSAIILSLVMPLLIQGPQPHFGPFIVQATIDAAVIAGATSSKYAKKYTLNAQKAEYLVTQASQTSEVVGWRKLYFRKLFSS